MVLDGVMRRQRELATVEVHALADDARCVMFVQTHTRPKVRRFQEAEGSVVHYETDGKHAMDRFEFCAAPYPPPAPLEQNHTQG